MKEVTICFPCKFKETSIDCVCLGMKKRGFGEGLWNGAGGKFNDEFDSSITDTAIRETSEEFNIDINELEKKGEIFYNFMEKDKESIHAHVFITKRWNKEPTESGEMKPRWFKTNNIPYNKMWESDRHWLPYILKNSFINGKFTYDRNDAVKKVELIIKN